jgi:hypothetical protein
LARRNCQTCSTGFNSGERDGRRIGVMFFGPFQIAPVVCHPARSSSSTAWAPLATMVAISSMWSLHGLGVGEGQRQRGADAARRADRAEQIGVLVALVGGLARPRAAPRPLPDQAVLLADPSLVLEPDLDGLARATRPTWASACARSFFERLHDLRHPG